MLIETIPILKGSTTHADLHEARMHRSALRLGVRPIPWTETWAKVEKHLTTTGQKTLDQVLRSTIVYDTEIREVRTVAYAIRDVVKLKLLEVPSDFDYSLKSADRSLFTPYSSQCQPGEEALLVRDGLLTDTTYTNIVVEYEDGRLLTPSTPLLEGTERASLISSHTIIPAPLTPDDLLRCRKVHLINAMMTLGALSVSDFVIGG